MQSKMFDLIDQKFDEQLDALGTLLSFPSVSQGEPEEGKPLGRHIHDALTYTLGLATKMGFSARSLDGYCGVIDYGEGDEMLMIMAHLDVVPAGNGCAGDPFGMIRREGYVLGRGVADDKGPAVLTLYAAKFFAQRGEPLPYTLRLLFGTNEETGMAGLSYYLAHNAAPAFCFRIPRPLVT